MPKGAKKQEEPAEETGIFPSKYSFSHLKLYLHIIGFEGMEIEDLRERVVVFKNQLKDKTRERNLLQVEMVFPSADYYHVLPLLNFLYNRILFNNIST